MDDEWALHGSFPIYNYRDVRHSRTSMNGCVEDAASREESDPLDQIWKQNSFALSF